MKTLSLFLSIILFTAFAPKPAEDIPVTINITDIRADENGVIIISIYKTPENFPYEPYEVFKVEKSKVVNGTLLHTFKVATEGQYAISLLDDSNENNDMDTNFIGIPKEGYGFSNDAGPRGFSPPTFDDAAFSVETNGVNITAKMNYFL